MLYIPWLIYFLPGSFYLLTLFSHFACPHPLLLVTTNLFLYPRVHFCFVSFFFFLDFMYSEILKLITWTTALSNQSILKEMSPECSLEGLMMKLKLQYFGYLMQRTGSLGKTLILAKIEGRRRRGQHRMLSFQNKWKPICSSWQMKNIGPRTWWTWVWASSGSPRWTGKVVCWLKAKGEEGGRGWDV